MERKKVVLLVDDDVDLVDSNRIILETNGYKVNTAYNGKECKKSISKEKPDVIVLDIMMDSVSDGMYVAQDLHRDSMTKNIPIIVVSSLNDGPHYRMGPDESWLPVSEFLEKPVAPEVLLHIVKRKIGA